MTTSIDKIWQLLESSSESGYRQIRFSDKSVVDFFLALSENKYRLAVLYVPDKLWPSFTGINDTSFENLSLSFSVRNGKGWFSIRLKSIELSEYFNDLIYSLWRNIEYITDQKECADQFIKTYWKWANFFNHSPSGKLSIDEIMGLFGELLFLRTLLNENKWEPDIIVKSWNGPFKGEKDFVLPDSVVEIKAHSFNSTTVTISSLNQLEKIDKRKVILGLISLIIGRTGTSLYDIIEENKNVIEKRGGDVSTYMARLNSMGINNDNLLLYKTPLFTYNDFNFYNTETIGFPKLTRDEILNNKIVDVKYSIRISSINEFKCSLENIKK